MSNFRMLMVSLCAMLCAWGCYAQQPIVLSLKQIYALADENSKAILAEDAAVAEAQQEVNPFFVVYSSMSFDRCIGCI